jgi:hypothetical protein
LTTQNFKAIQKERATNVPHTSNAPADQEAKANLGGENPPTDIPFFSLFLMLRMRAPFNRKKFKGIAAGNGSTRFQFRVAFELLCLGVGIF